MARDYSGLSPKFRPGGGKDPRWMAGVRNLLPSVLTVEATIVRDLFEYYDAVCEQLSIERKLNGSDPS